MALRNIAAPSVAIADFCRRHHIQRLAVFGSVLRADFRPDSDVDVLVEFEPGDTPGLSIFDLDAELSDLLGGRKVDLLTPSEVNRWIRARVLATAEPVYENGRLVGEEQWANGQEETAIGEAGPVPVRERRSLRRGGMRPVEKDDLLYFGHMLDTARRTGEIVRGVDREAYDANETLRLALVYLVQTIGEAARKVSRDGRAAHPDIPQARIVGMRYRLVHDYTNVDEDKLWETVTDDLPALVAVLERFVPLEPPA